MRSAFLLLSLAISVSACGSIQHAQLCKARLGDKPRSMNDSWGLVGALTKPADVADSQERWNHDYWACTHEPHHVWTADNE